MKNSHVDISPTEDDPKPVEEETKLEEIKHESFMRNVREAREMGLELVCAECGEGQMDMDIDPENRDHDMLCSHNPKKEENEKEISEWWVKEQAKKEEKNGA